MRRLAVAVLQRAAFDAAGMVYSDAGGDLLPSTRDARRSSIAAEAYDWLTTPGASLDLWTEVAGIAMRDVIDGADTAVEYAKRRSVEDRRRMKG